MNWQRGRSYGQDLRDKMFAAIDRGRDPKAVATAFTVSVSWIYKAVGRRRSGLVASGVTRGDFGHLMLMFPKGRSRHVLPFQFVARHVLGSHWLLCVIFLLEGGGRDKNLWSGLSNLDFCDCSLFSHRWGLRHARRSLSGHVKIAFVHDVWPGPISLSGVARRCGCCRSSNQGAPVRGDDARDSRSRFQGIMPERRCNRTRPSQASRGARRAVLRMGGRRVIESR
jgi:hypothetical protein